MRRIRKRLVVSPDFEGVALTLAASGGDEGYRYSLVAGTAVTVDESSGGGGGYGSVADGGSGWRCLWLGMRGARRRGLR